MALPQGDGDPGTPERQGWQPIETAPKDFHSVLATDGAEVRVSHYDYHAPGWIADMPYTHPMRLWEPTHWMPLPDPPEAQS